MECKLYGFVELNPEKIKTGKLSPFSFKTFFFIDSIHSYGVFKKDLKRIVNISSLKNCIMFNIYRKSL